MKINQAPPFDSLPLRYDLTFAYVSSLVIALIMTIVAVLGILYRSLVYSGDTQLLSFTATDVLNLVIGLPVLLGSMWLTRRDRLIGLLCWPGALFYVLYIYLTYLLAVPFHALFLAYLALVTLSVYTIIGIIAGIDSAKVRQRLTGVVPAKVAGGILVGIAVMFTLQQLSVIITSILSDTPIGPLERAHWVDDFIVAYPALFIGGVLLWRGKALGYVIGTGALLLSSMLFLGVVPVMISEAFLKNTPIDVIGILVVLAMGLVSFIPFALFVRGVLKSR